MVRFSDRVPRDLRPNRLGAARARLGTIPFDLTESNPTRCELPYHPELVETLADARALDYAPHPRGPLDTRRAIAARYTRWHTEVDPGRVVLTASTSEAYSCLFRLLADPGDSVLIPTPSYPLIEHLARLDGVEAATYRLDPDFQWRIDPDDLLRAPARTRAIVVVHPNNPTGSFVHPEDAARVAGLCAVRGWALIADEVFLSYPLADDPGADFSFAADRDCLGFALGGLSKSVGLPQMKLAWIVVSGPRSLVSTALARLDHVSDAYLSVSTPVAVAAPRLLAGGEALQHAIHDRCRLNLATLTHLTDAAPAITLLSPRGGWSAVLRVPTVIDEEELLLGLLADQGVAAYPGYFFDFDRDGYLVVSLLPPEHVFREGARRLVEKVAATV